MGVLIFILPPEENSQARWIGLKEASKYAKIGKNRLINLAQTGLVIGGQDSDNKRGDWIFDRESIDQYRLDQFSVEKDRKKVLKILHGVG